MKVSDGKEWKFGEIGLFYKTFLYGLYRGFLKKSPKSPKFQKNKKGLIIAI